MKLAITGANGFIGRHVVTAALAAGYHVVAIIRSRPPAEWQDIAALEVIRCDLLTPQQAVWDSLQAVDTVIHLAAPMAAGDEYTAGVTATENLLQLMRDYAINRLFLLSSISVLDYAALPPASPIDETVSPGDDYALGDYARMKRDQECVLAGQLTTNPLFNYAVFRPGIVYDKQRLAADHAGLVIASKALCVLHSGQVPLVHVHRVAQLLIAAVDCTVDNGSVYHLLDEQLPEQREYIEQLRARGLITPVLYLPWRWYSALTKCLRGVLAIIGASGRCPDRFRRGSVAARLSPFAFSGEKAQTQLRI